MIDKALMVIAYFAIAFVGLAALPYLLWRVWDNTIPFNKKGKGVDLDYSASKPVGQL